MKETNNEEWHLSPEQRSSHVVGGTFEGHQDEVTTVRPAANPDDFFPDHDIRVTPANSHFIGPPEVTDPAAIEAGRAALRRSMLLG